MDSQKAPAIDPIWVSVNDAIRASGIHRTRLYELLNSGALGSIKVGRKRLVSFDSIKTLGQPQAS